ncbi:drab5-related [Holotrichia oblita]|uniref:Drab5-related n=1 Tax=Holotrichia oblita TaxID=644536 RepID=A0ACB9TD43_HOLOL|nr:drab5-related [Holotrichia oblita]
MFNRSSLFLKRISKHVAYNHQTVPGENLPWSIKSIWGMTIRMAIFYGIGFAAPFGIGGKTLLANYLADLNINLPEDLKPTKGLRIVEYDLNNIMINGENSNVDVQIWDASGDENQEDELGVRKLDYMYNYFVSQPNRSLKSCLVCCVQAEENNARLSSVFSKMSQIAVNLENQGEKFKQDFSKYVVSVVSTMSNK